MINGSIAKRYAIALYEEAKAQFVDQQVYDHLGMLHASMEAEPDFQMALINPRVTIEKKYTLLLLASGLDKEGLLPRFYRLLLENHRENQLRIIIFVYRDMYREQHGIDRISKPIATVKWNVCARSTLTSSVASDSASVTAVTITVININLKR